MQKGHVSPVGDQESNIITLPVFVHLLYGVA